MCVHPPPRPLIFIFDVTLEFQKILLKSITQKKESHHHEMLMHKLKLILLYVSQEFLSKVMELKCLCNRQHSDYFSYGLIACCPTTIFLGTMHSF